MTKESPLQPQDEQYMVLMKDAYPFYVPVSQIHKLA